MGAKRKDWHDDASYPQHYRLAASAAGTCRPGGAGCGAGYGRSDRRASLPHEAAGRDRSGGRLDELGATPPAPARATPRILLPPLPRAGGRFGRTRVGVRPTPPSPPRGWPIPSRRMAPASRSVAAPPILLGSTSTPRCVPSAPLLGVAGLVSRSCGSSVRGIGVRCSYAGANSMAHSGCGLMQAPRPRRICGSWRTVAISVAGAGNRRIHRCKAPVATPTKSIC